MIKLRQSLRCLLAVISLHFGSAALAGPDDITNRLMDEQVTMLDFGIFRLQDIINKLSIRPHPSVDFDWDRNLILIRAWTNAKETGTSELHDVCAEWFSQIRTGAGVNPDTGKLIEALNGASMFSRLFNHYGFEKTIEGKSTSEISKMLDGKFLLEITWFGAPFSGNDIKEATCSAPLVDKGFSTKIEKWDDG